jgi:hypothetical protein
MSKERRELAQKLWSEGLTSSRAIAKAFCQEHKIKVSHMTIARLLRTLKLEKPAAGKKLPPQRAMAEKFPMIGQTTGRPLACLGDGVSLEMPCDIVGKENLVKQEVACGSG